MYKALLWTLALLLSAPGFAENQHRPFIRPSYLQTGDTVGIVAPASKLAAKADTARVRARFEAMGLKVKFAPHLFSQTEPYFAATDAERAADLQAMIDDDNVRAIVAYKGGYGSVRLLDKLDLRKLRRHPKWIVGYSDITMLHLAMQEAGIESIHATMPANFKYEKMQQGVSADSIECINSLDPSAAALRQALFGELQQISLPPHPFNSPGKASGRLTGGNLTVFCSAIGTPEEPDTEESFVLLIEDIGEQAYRIDRMMQQLLRSGKLAQASAILVGHFTDIAKADTFTPDGGVWGLIRSYTDPLGIPVVFGFPAGHEQPNLALYMGRRIEVRVNDTGTTITF